MLIAQLLTLARHTAFYAQAAIPETPYLWHPWFQTLSLVARSRVLVSWLLLDGACRLVTETSHDHILLLSEVLRAGARLHAFSRNDSLDLQ